MRHERIGTFAAAICGLLGCLHPATAEQLRLSGPYVHDNLAVYLVHGESTAGPVPLTLAEALAAGRVVVHETAPSTSCPSRTPAPTRSSSRPAISSKAASRIAC